MAVIEVSDPEKKADININRNRFCSVCGSNTIPTKSGHQRNCTNKTCASLHFPRTDPAVIMLVKDENRILLGRQKIWPDGLQINIVC